MTVNVLNQKLYLPAALRWLKSISSNENWKLSVVDLAAILDEDVKNLEALLSKASENINIEVDNELTDKIAMLIQIHKYLSRIAPIGGSQKCNNWFNQPNSSSIFNGLTIKEYLCVHSTPASLKTVIRYLASN